LTGVQSCWFSDCFVVARVSGYLMYFSEIRKGGDLRRQKSLREFGGRTGKKNGVSPRGRVDGTELAGSFVDRLTGARNMCKAMSGAGSEGESKLSIHLGNQENLYGLKVQFITLNFG